MTEPWCWPADVIARMTDADIEAVRRAQAAKVRDAVREQKGEPPPQSDSADPENVRAALAEIGVTDPAAVDRAMREARQRAGLE